MSHHHPRAMLGRLFSRLLPVTTLLISALNAWAATDAGSVLQQLEPRPAPALKAPSLQTPQAPTPSASELAGPVLRVNSFRIAGATLIGEPTLQAALSGFVGRELSLTQLQEAAWVVTQTYRQAGWLVNAFVPQQEIEQGEVKLQVVEARLGAVRVDVQPSVRIAAEQVQAMVLAQMQSGQALNVNALDSALMRIGELAGVVASASFTPGQIDGSTDVLVLVGGGKRVDMALTIDNHGARSTGRQRVSTTLNFNSLMGMGDQLSVNLVNTSGSTYHRAAFSVPVGPQGLRLGAHSSDMSYGFDWNGSDISGVARTVGLDASGPVQRSAQSSWSWALSTDQKQLRNLANDALTSQYRIDLARASLSGVWIEGLLGSAQNNLTLNLTQGKVNHPVDTTGVKGSFAKLNLSFTREQALGDTLRWYTQAQTQSANSNLDSSEKLYLGGPSGVRAYPTNEVGGASGYAVTTGLRQRLGQGWQLSGFVDWGRVTVCREQLQACLRNSEPNTQALRGFGASVQWQTEPGLDLSVTWSRRQGNNPLASSAGLDSDQTRVSNRLWLSAAVRF